MKHKFLLKFFIALRDNILLFKTYGKVLKVLREEKVVGQRAILVLQGCRTSKGNIANN